MIKDGQGGVITKSESERFARAFPPVPKKSEMPGPVRQEKGLEKANDQGPVFHKGSGPGLATGRECLDPRGNIFSKVMDNEKMAPEREFKARMVDVAREGVARSGHPEFYRLLSEIADLHDRKNSNYAQDTDPLSNLKRCRNLNLKPSFGVIVRLQDKWSRIEELAKGKPDLVGESLEDTLMDNAIYSLLAIVLMREGL